MAKWSGLFDRVKQHPIYAGIVGVGGFVVAAAGFWALLSPEPFLPSVYAVAKAWITMNTIGAVLIGILVLLPVGIVAIIVAIAVHHKRDAAGLRTRLDGLADYQDIKNDRDASARMFKQAKADFGHAMLRWNAGLVFYESNKPDEHREVTKPIVTIRSGAYGTDYDLVKQIERVIAEDLGWQVTLDGKNDPMLPQAKDFKVLFDSGLTQSFEKITTAFAVGDFLGVPVGQSTSDRTDYHHLVVKVLPSGGE